MDDTGGEDLAVWPTGPLARVVKVDELARAVWFRLANGNAGSATLSEPTQLEPGDIVVLRENGLDPAPPELWPADRHVGVVKIRHDDYVVVASGGLFRMIPSTGTSCAVGNTVEFDPDLGVVQVLQDQPIGWLDNDDPEVALRNFRSTVRPPDMFGEIGGLEGVVSRARELIEVPIKQAGLLSHIGARPIKGVLFTGPPGTGKTMLAKAIAASAEATFYEVRGPEVFSKWLGRSEELLRLIFDDARKQNRSIIFFDEIDSVAGNRDGDSHEASRRVVAQLLTLLDGFSSADNVVVIAATNRPEDLDPAIRRPGRFDWEIAFPLPSHEGRLQILRRREQTVTCIGPLPHQLVAGLTEGWSGAELAAIYSEAALVAVSEGRAAISGEDYLIGFERVRAVKVRPGNGGGR